MQILVFFTEFYLKVLWNTILIWFQHNAQYCGSDPKVRAVSRKGGRQTEHWSKDRHWNLLYVGLWSGKSCSGKDVNHNLFFVPIVNDEANTGCISSRTVFKKISICWASVDMQGHIYIFNVLQKSTFTVQMYTCCVRFLFRLLKSLKVAALVNIQPKYITFLLFVQKPQTYDRPQREYLSVSNRNQALKDTKETNYEREAAVLIRNPNQVLTRGAGRKETESEIILQKISFIYTSILIM